MRRHVVDLGPTLFAGAAGGAAGPFANASEHKDGIDQWGAVSLGAGLNHSAPRTEVLLNLYGPDNNDASTYSVRVRLCAPLPSPPRGILCSANSCCVALCF